MRLSAPLLLSLTFVAARGSAQTHAFDKCEGDKVEVGFLRGSGTVRYTLTTSGQAAPGPVDVITVEGVSAAGFQSAATRQLAGCKMRRPPADLVVTQVIRFDSATTRLEPAVAATGTEIVIPIADAADAAPGAAATPEERPRWVACERGPRLRAVAGNRGTIGNPGSGMMSGSINARLVLDTLGRVMPDSVTLISTGNPEATSPLLRSIATCRFAPARAEGRGVPTAINAGMIASGGGYVVVVGPVISVLMGR